MDVEITGETAAAALPITIKKEPVDEDSENIASQSKTESNYKDSDGDDDDDVQYLGTEIVLRYLQGRHVSRTVLNICSYSVLKNILIIEKWNWNQSATKWAEEYTGTIIRFSLKDERELCVKNSV